MRMTSAISTPPITQRWAIDELRSRRYTSQRREVELPDALPLGGNDHA